MFHPFAFDTRHGVWFARFGGTLTVPDLAAFDAACRACMIEHGPTPGIADFDQVEGVAVSVAEVVSRGVRAQIMVGQKRAIVAHGLMFGLMRMFGVYQEGNGSVAPMIVRTLPEAYAALGLADRDFRRVASSATALPFISDGTAQALQPGDEGGANLGIVLDDGDALAAARHRGPPLGRRGNAD